MRKFLLVSVLMVFQIEVFASERPLLRILPEVKVSAVEPITLSDISELEQISPQDLGFLETIKIDQKFQWNSGELSQFLKQNLPVGNWRFHLPQRLEIKVERNLSKEHIERRISNYLKAQETGSKVEARVHSLPYIQEQVQLIDWSHVKKGSFLLPVSVGQNPNPVMISAQAKVQKLMPVAQRNLSTVVRVQKEDLKLDWVDVTFAKDREVSINDLIGQALTRPVMFNQPIWASYIKREPTVRKGQLIRAKTGTEQFEISLSVIAEEAGYVGDTIIVKPTDLQKKLSAVIESKESIRILE